jgi:hypothetical protein
MKHLDLFVISVRLTNEYILETFTNNLKVLMIYYSNEEDETSFQLEPETPITMVPVDDEDGPELFSFEEEPEIAVVATEEQRLKVLGIADNKEIDINELAQYTAYQTVLSMMHNNDSFLMAQFKGTPIEPIIYLKAELFQALQYMEHCHPSEANRAYDILDNVEAKIKQFAAAHFV